MPCLYTVSQHQLILPLGSTSTGTYLSTLLPADDHSNMVSTLHGQIQYVALSLHAKQTFPQTLCI